MHKDDQTSAAQPPQCEFPHVAGPSDAARG